MKSKKPFLPLLVLLAFSTVLAMEQDAEKSMFMNLPRELTKKIIFDTIEQANDIKKAAKQHHVLRMVNRACNTLITNKENSEYLVKTVHKKFKEEMVQEKLDQSKLTIRYYFNNPINQKKLLKRLEVITKYAFLHCTTLLRTPLRHSRLRPTIVSLTHLALERSCAILHQQRKNNAEFWSTTDTIRKEYNQKTSSDVITISFETKDSPHHNIDEIVKTIAAHLLYLAENNKELIINLHEPAPLCRLLCSRVDAIFMENPGICKSFCARISIT